MRNALYAVVGLGLIGALSGGANDTPLTSAATLPGLVLTMAGIMAPALYVGLALTGSTMAASRVLEASVEALGRMGLLCAGLAPALAFVSATSVGGGAVLVLSHATLACAALLGLRSLRADLGITWDVAPQRLLFAGWAAVALAIGSGLWLRLGLGLHIGGA